MFRNYLTIAIRHLLRHKGYSAINVVGLAIGMACCIVILLYVQDELSYDRYHKNAKRIYRVLSQYRDQDVVWGLTPLPLAPALIDEIPEVIDATRLSNPWSIRVSRGEKHFKVHPFIFADSTVLDVFTFPLLKGDPRTVLRAPESILITEDMARRYFGEEDPLGKVLTIKGGQERLYDLTVTGVLRNLPRNSHYRFECIASMPAMRKYSGMPLEEWGNLNCLTYVLLPRDYPPAALEEKLPDLLERHQGKGASSEWKLHLQPLTDIYLHSTRLKGDLAMHGSIAYVYLFSAIAVVVLLIACMNFMILATARSAARAKEVGLRKVVGASRPHLIQQFLGESLLLSCVALPLAVAVVELVLPTFNGLIGKELVIAYAHNWIFVAGLIGITIAVGLIAGSYPAFCLSHSKPVDVLKGALKAGARGALFREALVVFQFFVSIALIVVTLLIYRQVGYVRSKELGFSKEHVVVLQVPGLLDVQDLRFLQHYEAFKHEVLQHPNIVNVSGSRYVPPTSKYSSAPITLDVTPTTQRSIEYVPVDYDYFETLGIGLAAGRTFSQTFAADTTDAVVLNEEAVRELGLASPIGSHINVSGTSRTVVGVVRDFHYRDLHARIQPVVFHLKPRWISDLVIRIRPQQTSETVAFLQRTWKRFAPPDEPFEYAFLDERLESVYRSEQRLGRMMGAFTLLAVLIACLGLFGLASFAAEQRTKEIGIRKVLGASVTSIVLLLSKEFTKLVLVANVIAWPIAYYVMSGWLQAFAYRIEIGWGTSILGGMLALAIALVTVSFQAIKAALANPVDALRCE